jgi:hypothetical protein
MRIDASGNVGIGTTSPSGKLHVNNGRTFLVSESGDGYVLNLRSAGLTNGCWLTNPAENTFGVASQDGTERLRIDASGNVGIGKNNPATILDVNGTVTATAFAGPVTGNVTGDLTGTASAVADGAVTTAKIADANVTPAKLSQKLTFDTAKASTSGTSIDFTGIPSWAKRITLLFSGVSTSGTSDKRIRLGVGGSFVATGYVTSKARATTAAANGSSTAGFEFMNEGQAAEIVSGQMVFTNVTGNTWVGSGQLATTSGNQPGALFSGGNVALSGALDSIRVTTVNGTDTFDAGDINISYEG